jgi:hypothetical protein
MNLLHVEQDSDGDYMVEQTGFERIVAGWRQAQLEMSYLPLSSNRKARSMTVMVIPALLEMALLCRYF